jgi:predicted DNA-binding transcriptional regulator YafY
MSQMKRIVRLKYLLDTGRLYGKSQLMAELGNISYATLKRDLAFLRDQLNWPVVFDRHEEAYRLDPAQQGRRYELPGLRFTAEQIHALISMQHLLTNLQADSLLDSQIAPIVKRLSQIIEADSFAGVSLAQRIKVETVGARPLHLPYFQSVGFALLHRQRLRMGYHARTTDQPSEREVSPQRLIHYRGNWYLDAWCHLRESLRSFSVDAITHVQVQTTPALEVPEAELDAVLGSGYGIFAGKDVQWATLRFTPDRARWVAAEAWHPQQRGQFETDGSYLLQVPYADPRELLMDVMRHVPDVEVLSPPELREAFGNRLREGLENFLTGSRFELGG